MKFKTEKIKLTSLNETNLLAKIFVTFPVQGNKVYLSGDLGSGKTTFVQFVLKELGYQKKVTSPTFNLVKEYQINDLVIFHLDAYRLEGTDNVFDFEEALYDPRVLSFIEWPEMIRSFLQDGALEVKFILENGIHYAIFESDNPAYEKLINKVNEEFKNV